MISRERRLEILALACDDAAAGMPPILPPGSAEERAHYLVFYEVAKAAWSRVHRAGHAFRPLARAFHDIAHTGSSS